jgi:hypothetical protein
MKLNAKHLATAGILLALASTPSHAADSNRKFCLNSATGGSSCGFTSMEQCRQTMQGRNGWCTEQVDFEAWAASHGQDRSASGPENSFAYYPPGGKLNRHLPQAVKDLEDLHRKNMPAKGVGAY